MIEQGDLRERIEQHHDIDMVCISAMSPAAVMRASHLSKCLRELLPDVRLLVGLWNFTRDIPKASTRIGCQAIVHTTLSSAHEFITKPILIHGDQPELHENAHRNTLEKMSVT